MPDGTSLAAAVLYSLLGLVPVSVAVVAWRYRDKTGATGLLGTASAVAAACFVQAFRFVEASMGIGEPLSVLLHVLLLVSINVAVLGALVIALEYTNRIRAVGPIQWAILLGLAVLLPLFRLLGDTIGVQAVGVAADLDFLYRVLVASAGLSLFAWQLAGAQGIYRNQAATLFIGLAIGAGFGLVERFYTVAFVEFTLLGMVAGSCTLAVALFRYEFLETAPVARETLFDHVSDPVVAIDEAARVADSNQAAREHFGLTDEHVGQPAVDVFDADPALASVHEHELDARETLGGVVHDERRHFDPDNPVVAALHDGEPIPDVEFGIATESGRNYYRVTPTAVAFAPDREGQLVVFREVTTERKRAEDLETLKEVLSRVLRHNLRNEVTVIRGFASAIAENGDESAAANAERIVDRTDALVKTSETARRIKNVIDLDEMKTVDLDELVERTVAQTRESYPEATIETSVPTVSVVLNPEFDTALAELLDNAISHNDDTQPTVTVDATRTARGVELTISDNGPGIPAHELQVLDRGEETSLVHGSGAGLWLIQTAVDHSNGSCQFETSDAGTSVVIRLQTPQNDE